ncbi:MAG: nucleotidyltransferase family protein [bacterium]|nr:nucleotidyltransferase family protein [bacterium]
MTEGTTDSRYSARQVLVRLLRRALDRGVGNTGGSSGAQLRIRGGADEELLVRSVMRHRVAAFLHPALEEGLLGEELPIDFVGLCRQAYFTTLRRNLVAMDVGEALLSVLEDRGLSAVPRGPWALARGSAPVHHDPGERPIGPLELALPAEVELEVRDVARGFGFEARDAGGVVWKSMGRMDLALQLRRNAPGSGAYASLLDAAAGLERDRFQCWVGLLDVHRLVVAGGFSPYLLGRQAKKEGLGRAVGSSLRLARSVLATPVPAPWRARAHQHRDRGRVIPPAFPPSTALL